MYSIEDKLDIKLEDNFLIKTKSSKTGDESYYIVQINDDGEPFYSAVALQDLANPRFDKSVVISSEVIDEDKIDPDQVAAIYWWDDGNNGYSGLPFWCIYKIINKEEDDVPSSCICREYNKVETKEMTVEEVSKALGYPVRIIKG